LSSKTIARRFPPPLKRFHLIGNKGFVSDDTEQSALLAQAIIKGKGVVADVVRNFRRSLLGWFLRLPFGIGFSTLKACLRICFGFREPGVRSAGNGAAMRISIAGGFFLDDPETRKQIVVQTTKLTHTDPRSIDGALFTAELAALGAKSSSDNDRTELVRQARDIVSDDEIRGAIDSGINCAEEGSSDHEATTRLGNTGYVVHTIGLATYMFIAHGDDPLRAIQHTIAAGGDTDTIAAIVGAWTGALHGENALPPELIDRIHDGPFGPSHLRALADSMSDNGESASVPHWSWIGAMARNLALYPIVLTHGFRRLLP
jgi:ADP-ribosylglycohydrolase